MRPPSRHRPFIGPLVSLVLVGASLVMGPAAADPAAGGGQLWAKGYNGPGNSADTAYSLAASPDGTRVFVTGQSWASGYDYATIAYASTTGSVLWARRYNGPGNGSDNAKSVSASPDGSRVFVTGGSGGVDTGYDYATIAYDAATGAVLWATRYNGPANGYDVASSLATSPDGSTVFVTGGSDGVGTYGDYATIAYDSTTGAVVWARRYNGPDNGSEVAVSVAASPDGSEVFVTGFRDGGASSFDYATIAYDAATGAVLWAKWYNGPDNDSDYATSLAASADGSTVVVTGYSWASDLYFGYDFATIAYDAATGAVLWARRYNDPDNGYDYATSLAASADGSTVFVTGQSWDADTSTDFATIAYDAATGAVVWARRYNGPGMDSPTSLAASPDGSTVYVTGYSRGLTTTDLFTISYDAATGGMLWATRYSGPDNGGGSANSVAAGPDGSTVFVTGQSWVSGTNDYATVAFEA
jgi:outer membrane protein assembly factor BamB